MTKTRVNPTSPTLYTSSAQYDALFAIKNEDSAIMSNYYNATVGATFTVISMADASIITLYMKSKTLHISNNVAGIFFY